MDVNEAADARRSSEVASAREDLFKSSRKPSIDVPRRNFDRPDFSDRPDFPKRSRRDVGRISSVGEGNVGGRISSENRTRDERLWTGRGDIPGISPGLKSDNDVELVARDNEWASSDEVDEEAWNADGGAARRRIE